MKIIQKMQWNKRVKRVIEIEGKMRNLRKKEFLLDY